jgi:hypothetical protein
MIIFFKIEIIKDFLPKITPSKFFFYLPILSLYLTIGAKFFYFSLEYFFHFEILLFSFQNGLIKMFLYMYMYVK